MRRLGQGDHEVGNFEHARVVVADVGFLEELRAEPVEPDQPRVFEGRELRRHPVAYPVGPAGGSQDPAVPLARDHPFRRPDLSEPVQVTSDLRRERQAVPGGEPRDLLPAGLQPFDLVAQLAVDLADRRGEGRRVGFEQLADPAQRHAGVGEGADLD